jgi:endonuclease YncB( thermonuclease family)
MRQWLLGATLALVSFACSAAAAHAAEVRVLDGDSFEWNGETIRLWGIDTPEPKQQCTRQGKPWFPAQESMAMLRGILEQAEGMTCSKRDVDRFGRAVSTCRAHGRDIGHQMVVSGWAWDYFENSGGFYIAVETEARVNARGVWQGDCSTPWRWRRAQQQPGAQAPISQRR